MTGGVGTRGCVRCLSTDEGIAAPFEETEPEERFVVDFSLETLTVLNFVHSTYHRIISCYQLSHCLSYIFSKHHVNNFKFSS